ncbi:hypothetical protein ACU6U9_02770 [Pseudomonas sp. HK3]
MSTSINTFLSAIKDRLHEVLPELNTCDVHDGRFDVSELKRISTKAPAVFVALLKVPSTKTNSEDQLEADLSLVAYIVTKEAHKLDKGEAARNLSEAIMILVKNERWSTIEIERASDIRGDNLYSGAIDKQNIALWAITWKQTITLGDKYINEDDFLPSEFYAVHDDTEKLT